MGVRGQEPNIPRLRFRIRPPSVPRRDHPPLGWRARPLPFL